jgi:hypothetical protein
MFATARWASFVSRSGVGLAVATIQNFIHTMPVGVLPGQTSGRRVPLIYGQPYGRLPYGRFPDSFFFPFLEIFLSFSEKNKFKQFFYESKKFSK